MVGRPPVSGELRAWFSDGAPDSLVHRADSSACIIFARASLVLVEILKSFMEFCRC